MKMFAVGIGFAIALSSAARAQDVAIAVVGPMTGPLAFFGTQMRNAAELAVRNLNASGGIAGRKVVLSVEDDAGDPRQGVSVANRLASRKVKFVVGNYNTPVTMAATDVYAENGMIAISPSSSNPRVTDVPAQKGLWNIFRVCGRDDFQGGAGGDYLAARYPAQPIAILHDNQAFGKGLAEEVRKALGKKGTTEALFAAYTPGDKDFSALIARMKELDVKAIYLGGYFTEAGLLIRQARQAGLGAVLHSGDGILAYDFAIIAGSASEGTMMTFVPDTRDTERARPIVEQFRAKSIEPEGWTLNTYAAFEIFKQAIEKAGSWDQPEKIAATMRGGTPFDTVIGPVTFDKKGDFVNAKWVWYRWEGGKYHQVKN